MTNPNEFDSYRHLQEITNATDEQLMQMIAYACGDLPFANYEDAFLEVLLRYFRHISGVPWVRAWQQGARPTDQSTDGFIPANGQYGTIQLLSFEPHSIPSHTYESRADADGQPIATDVCEMISMSGKYVFQLDVYRDAGEGNRNQQGGATAQTPTGSAFDVLIRIRTRMHHFINKMALRQYCIQHKDSALTGITNLTGVLVQETYEGRSTARFECYAQPASKMRLPVIPSSEFIEFEFVNPPEPEVVPEIEC